MTETELAIERLEKQLARVYEIYKVNGNDTAREMAVELIARLRQLRDGK